MIISLTLFQPLGANKRQYSQSQNQACSRPGCDQSPVNEFFVERIVARGPKRDQDQDSGEGMSYYWLVKWDG